MSLLSSIQMSLLSSIWMQNSPRKKKSEVIVEELSVMKINPMPLLQLQQYLLV